MASGNDMKAANESYAGFLGLLKVSAIVAALATAFVIFLISR